MLPLRFQLGEVTVKEEAAYALSLAGQDADFFLGMHASGTWGEGNAEMNERGLREGVLVLSKYRTLRGHEILVATFPARGETHVFCPPNSVIKYVPLPELAFWQEQADQPRPEEGGAMKGQQGNGSDRFVIGHLDMGGWVRIHASGTVPPELPVFLSHTLAEWLRQHPQFRLVSVVPISRDGATVELHAWYECHVFPASPAAPKPIK